jgi:protease IV
VNENRTWIWIIIAIVVVLFLTCGGCALLALVSTMIEMPSATTGNAVAIIELKGTIVSGSGPRRMQSGVVYADNVIEDLRRAEEDPAVRAVVIEISSPGGGVVASADIHAALLEMTKPVVATMVDIGASGAYYVAAGAQRILVRSSTITGSIGVIATFVNADGLFDKLGIEQQVVKTGLYKDQGSLYRPLTEEELAMLQAMLEDSLDRFVEAVVEGRDMPEQQVRQVADGRIMSGQRAIELGLADEVGRLDDAVRIAAELGGIVGEPRRIHYTPETLSFFDLLLQTLAPSAIPTEVALVDRVLGDQMAPTLQYLYVRP